MSHKIDRLQLIRERHRKLILEPRRRKEYRPFADWGDDDFEPIDTFDEEVFLRELRDEDLDDGPRRQRARGRPVRRLRAAPQERARDASALRTQATQAQDREAQARQTPAGQSPQEAVTARPAPAAPGSCGTPARASERAPAARARWAFPPTTG